MNRNRLVVALTVCLMVVGAFALSHQPSPAPLVAQAIDGNADLLPAPSTYLVTCYPKNWKSDPASQQLLSDLAKPELAELRQAVATKTYVDGDPDFEHRYQSGHNTGPVSKLPAVLVMRDGQQVYRRSGSDVKYAAAEIGKFVDKFRPCPCPKPEPTPEPEPDDDRPTVPDSPDVVVDTPAVLAEEFDPLRVALCFMIGGAITWAVMFKRGM